MFVSDCELTDTSFDLKTNNDFIEITNEQIKKISQFLSVKEEQLAYLRSKHDEDGYIFQSKNDLYKTKRLIKRDGIDFYNYYTLPAPAGHVAPVILDILCPSNLLPKLNNGHFEAAITINLGPGPINGRWGEELNELNMSVLDSNSDEETSWITGASYFEPSYCPHTYSLVTNKPAKILSYTVANTLDNFLSGINTFSIDQQKNYQESLGKPLIERTISNQMSLLGFTPNSLAENCEMELDVVKSFIKGDFKNISTETIREICKHLNLDHRVLILPEITGDALGKTIFSISKSLDTRRIFKEIEWASAASSINSPDLTGSFMRVQNKSGEVEAKNENFMYFSKNSHYLVTSGNLIFLSKDSIGKVNKLHLKEEDSLWVKPFQSHAFIGDGSLIKMSNGEGVEYTNDFSFGNLFNEQVTMKRAFQDNLDWGYD